MQGATVVGDAVRDAALGAPLTDKTDSTAGRGDFTPQVVGALGPDGVAGVKDLTLRLELTARVENTNIDDTDKKIEAFSDAMTKFNDNVDGVRDKILESSYAIGRLRQFFKAYFSAKALMDRDPAMRALVLASVRPPLREALPQRYLEPPIVVLTVCPEFLEGRPCTGEKGLGLGATCGFGGGISFGGPGRGLAGFRDAPADPALTSLALIGRQVARSDGPGVVTRDGRSFLRVALSAAPHARSGARLDLEHPWRGGDRYAGRPGGLPARALLLACALAGMFAAWSLGAASSAEEEPSRGAGTLLALTALSAAALPAAARLRGGLWGTEWLAFGAFAAASAATLAAQRRRSRWSQPVAVAFHLSVLAASVFILEDALGAGGSLLRGETFAAASSAAALVWIGASGLRLMTERWRTLCGRCRTWEGASLSAGFLSAAVVLASALFLSISAVLLPPLRRLGRTATHLGRSALAMAIMRGAGRRRGTGHPSRREAPRARRPGAREDFGLASDPREVFNGHGGLLPRGGGVAYAGNGADGDTGRRRRGDACGESGGAWSGALSLERSVAKSIGAPGPYRGGSSRWRIDGKRTPADGRSRPPPRFFRCFSSRCSADSNASPGWSGVNPPPSPLRPIAKCSRGRRSETEAAAKTHRDTERRKDGDAETDNKERTKNDTGTSPHVPPQKGYGNGTPTLTSSRGAGGGGSDGPHPPPFVWEAPDEPYERALALHPGPGGPGRDELGSAVVDRLKEMLTDRGGDPIFEDSGDAVLYQAKGGYEIGPKPGADGATEPESGDYLILGPTGGRKYLLLFPKGTGTLRILRYGAEGEFKLAE